MVNEGLYFHFLPFGKGSSFPLWTDLGFPCRRLLRAGCCLARRGAGACARTGLLAGPSGHRSHPEGDSPSLPVFSTSALLFWGHLVFSRNSMVTCLCITLIIFKIKFIIKKRKGDFYHPLLTSQELSYAGTRNSRWPRVRLALGPGALGRSLNFLHGGGRRPAGRSPRSRSPLLVPRLLQRREHAAERELGAGRS